MREWREQLASDEVRAVIEGFREALYVRFSEIVARARADPPGKSKGVKAKDGRQGQGARAEGEC